MHRIREDAKGIYLVTNGTKFRPGAVRGYSHYLTMTDGGLKAGGTVRVRKHSGAPLCTITLASGQTVTWHTEYRPVED
jgi:hypothetical protein